MLNSETTNIFKVIVVGDSAVGKTSVLSKFVYSNCPNSYISTIGVDFFAKTISYNNNSGNKDDKKSKLIKFQLWDTAGAERFRSITRNYYRNSAAAIIMYDVTSEDSFRNVKHWLRDLRFFGPFEMKIMLVGNKIDQTNKRVIPQNEALRYADSENLIYAEISAKLGLGINELFEKLADFLVNNDVKLKDFEIIKTNEIIEIKNKDCCVLG